MEIQLGWGCRLAGKPQPRRLQGCRARLLPRGPPLLASAGDTKPHVWNPPGREMEFPFWDWLVWKPGNSYLAAQERLALRSLRLVFQEGDERKLPAAFPKGRCESWDPTAGVRSLQTICLSVCLQARYNEACITQSAATIPSPPGKLTCPKIIGTRGRSQIWMGKSFAINREGLCTKTWARPRGLEGSIGAMATHLRKKWEAAFGASLSHCICTHRSGKHPQRSPNGLEMQSLLADSL